MDEQERFPEAVIREDMRTRRPGSVPANEDEYWTEEERNAKRD
jgi:hypothetical protein